MKEIFLITLGLFFLIAPCRAQEPDDSFSFYKSANLRAWHYAERLMRISTDPEREIIERDVASSAFAYWLLLKSGRTPKNPGFERAIKRVLVDSGLVRKLVYQDPLGRNGSNRRGISIKGVIIDDGNYLSEVKGFHGFVSALK